MTLTVDYSAKPIDLIPMRNAVSHLAADMLEGRRRFQVLVADTGRRFRSQNIDLPAPLVVLFPGYVELDHLEARNVTRRVLFARDRFQCQYCGKAEPPGEAMRNLTVDHVKPLHLFPRKQEATTWENVVAACQECNHLKGGRLPRECGMTPLRTPRQPHYVQLRFSGKLREEQRDYILDYYGEEARNWL